MGLHCCSNIVFILTPMGFEAIQPVGVMGCNRTRYAFVVLVLLYARGIKGEIRC